MPSRKPPPYIPPPPAPPKPWPEGKFKCADCGKFLLLEEEAPGWSHPYRCCKVCSPRRRIENPFTNPLGPSTFPSPPVEAADEPDAP